MTDAEPRLSNRETMERALRTLAAFAAWPSTEMTRLAASSRFLWHERGGFLIAKAEARVPEIIGVMKGCGFPRRQRNSTVIIHNG
ncbi:hypothetical protein [Variovorax paradoxus]|jgi:uncharacterized protein YaaQ|uniref:hypothetical protein n=1 Tax=Variovorax paradoxus TaxID=34073 RepID=UPI0033925A5A